MLVVGLVHVRFIVRVILEGGGWEVYSMAKGTCACVRVQGPMVSEDLFRPSPPRPWL